MVARSKKGRLKMVVWGRIETLAIKSNPIPPSWARCMPPCFTIPTLPYCCPEYCLAEGTAGDCCEEVHVRSGLARGIVDIEVYQLSGPEDDAELERNTYPRLPAASSTSLKEAS